MHSLHATAPLPPSDLRGAMVGGYRVERELGRGATSVVYAATHPLLGTNVAVKVLHRELSVRPDLTERFVQEARAVAALKHPHIVQIYDLVNLPDGRLCAVMEYLAGKTLDVEAGGAPMAPTRAKSILLQLCSALSSVHRRGIVHRDLKAQNVMLVRGYARDHVKLLDFGLAKDEAGRSDSTSPGSIVGTPHYMAPEQVLGGPIDRRVDVYALGVLAYRLLTGRVPFEGSPAEVMFHHVRTAPVEPSIVPLPLRQIILKAMAKPREDRHPDVGVLSRELQECRLSPLTAGASRPRFASDVDGSTVTLRFASVSAFDHVARYELAMGRLFVPAPPPAVPGLLTLVVHVPGRGALSAPATLLDVFDTKAAEKHGISEGFALTLRGELVKHQEGPAPWAAITQSTREERSPSHIPVAFGATQEPSYLGVTANVSWGGVGLVSPYVLPIGAPIHLAITVGPHEIARCQGTVVWTRPPRLGAPTAALGVQLSLTDDVYRRYVRSVLPSPLADAAMEVAERAAPAVGD